MATDPGQRDTKVFLSHHLMSTTPPPHWSVALPPFQTSRRRRTLWGAPRLEGSLRGVCLQHPPLPSKSNLVSNPPRQKQDLPSSQILPYSLKTQELFLSKILALSLLPEAFKVVGCLQKLDWFWTHPLPEQRMTQWVESWGQQAKWGKEEHLLFPWSFISPQQNSCGTTRA